MRCVALAGVSGVGKSTVARILERVLGYPVVEVEARECWSYPVGVRRQACFARKFASIIGKREAIYTNSVYSVAAYTLAMKIKPEFEISEPCRTVVLAVSDPDELARRIIARSVHDKQRMFNITEFDVGLHWEAQLRLLRIAAERGLPVVWSDEKPVKVAETVVKVLRRYGFR